MAEYHLGISAYYHDSAAALVCDGQPVAAAQEERFSRKRHDPGFPADAVKYCLSAANITLGDLTSVAYYEQPRLKLARTLSSFASAGPAGLSSFVRIGRAWLAWKLDALGEVNRELAALGLGSAPSASARLHHRSHAAAAFYPSPFKRAAVLCIDGVGEWHTTTIWRGSGDSLELVNSVSYPHSLGLLYSAFTYFCGFKVDSGEYKLMGLAPYGRPIYADLIEDKLIKLRPDGSFSLALQYFEFLHGKRMVGEHFENLFARPRRMPESPLTQRECDIAASIQLVTDKAVLALAKAAREQTGEDCLCMAGGVALNCVSNGKLAETRLFKQIWIQPAAGDAGCALGAALDASVANQGRALSPNGAKDLMQGAYLGPCFEDHEITEMLQLRRIPHRLVGESEMLDEVADVLASGAVVGWFQGRMEFGPRALGARSILGDPRAPEMQRKMNLKIKHRESFRPFAPAVLKEDAPLYFDIYEDSPYMLIVSPVRAELRVTAPIRMELGSIHDVRSVLPAVTHLDFSARVQTVDDSSNPRFAELLRRFKGRTGVSVLVNTSFNVRGEPIVCTPTQAYTCFMRTEIDTLVLGRCILRKEEQPPMNDIDWRSEIPLD